MHRLMIPFAIAAAIFAGWNVSFAAEPSAAQDVIMITSLSPDTLVSGEEVEITVKIAYALRGYDSGAIRLTANTLAPNGDRSVASVAVKRGEGEVVLQAKILPRYWSDSVSFGVNAALVVAAGDALQTKALSLDRANFRVRPASQEKPANFWPTPAATYVDGVSIVSISPETFTPDVEQEIVVKVKYELLSREEGQIALAASYGSLAARRRVGAMPVKIGKGEAEIRARFIPRKTAGLPVARLLITLSETPSTRGSSPLAWDEASVAVK
jgi:hypothetical protein